jgi:peptidoglycan/LPS O-acetylase OafA/YrhL
LTEPGHHPLPRGTPPAVPSASGAAPAPRPELLIPSLDGIRALSFFIVFVSHAGLGQLVPGGFGVTVFFLLSGFLITTLLRLEYQRSGTIWLGGFYLRRVLRILPPLYLTLLFAAGVYLLWPGDPTIPVEGTLAQVLHVSNFYQIFATPGLIIPGTGVLWSLAVEEHFYLVFPLLYLWMAPRLSATRQAQLLLGFCILALVWRGVLRLHFDVATTRTFYGTDTRFDSILFGCIFALVASPVFKDPLHERALRHMPWVLPASAVGLLVSLGYRNDDFRETARYTLQGVSLVPLFIAAIHYQQAWPVRLLNLRFVRFLGVLSYSMYLCHHVILESAAQVLPGQELVAGAVSLLLTFGYAAAMHYAVERPFAAQRKRLTRRASGARVGAAPSSSPS